MNLTMFKYPAYNRRTTTKAVTAPVNFADFLRLYHTGALSYAYGGLIAVNTIPFWGNSSSRLLSVVETRLPYSVGDTLTKTKGFYYEHSICAQSCACENAFANFRPTTKQYSCFCCCQFTNWLRPKRYFGLQSALFSTRSAQCAISNCIRRFGTHTLIQFIYPFDQLLETRFSGSFWRGFYFQAA